jgi:hypothetical protein
MRSRLLLAAVAIVFLAGCDEPPASDKVQQEQSEQLAQQGNAQVGMPGVTSFTEKKLVRTLYELRDQKIATFAYIPDMNGRLWHLCDSIGYGLPYGTQFSNPEKHVWQNSAAYNIPQAEPNGLFMPPSAEGTWIMCSDPKKKGDIAPVYVEPRVIVSPFRLRANGEYTDQ